tara:strand:+ start:651 stop:854 length:204 start_codon:yes stop_codon:yes gene_type:complete
METPLQEAKLWHKMTGHEYFVLSDGSFWPWYWFDGNQHKIHDIVDSSGDGSTLEPLLAKIEKQKLLK